MEEEWRHVKGYEGLYEVSNMGRVRSLPRTVRKRGNKTSLYEGKLLSPIAYENGKKTGVSLSVTLCDGEKKLNAVVARMVATAFLLNPNHYKYVSHIDGNPFNNQASNLIWSSDCATHLCSSVNAYDLQGNFIGSYKSMSEASRKLDVAIQTISNSCHNKVTNPTRYIFEFAE